ncbi:dicarboxylic amino acid permease [Colletotrichum phormii]|uniref:Dicarboxylic amino acid permease n=1 Tax=Colletotrichum phormii TaxID=359342 RepID=A0AAI9ZHI7_9PEZI|nr:dicarboxylic amino acid permease [Colletotrichum phormii]KAK1623665.1 dicarboxylic amino acid permease [Colletotrichum phormii]
MGHSISNVEGTSTETTGERQQLKREFKERHVSMIAVAGAIGTGLIIGSGTGLVRGGPASLLIAYTLIGAVVFFIMTAGFAGYATRFVDPALGYATGWNYFLKYAIVLPNNLTAAGIIMQYWRPDLNVAITAVNVSIPNYQTTILALINHQILHVSFFGEAEFWMSAVKLLVIITLILTCFIISMSGQPSHEIIGFKYWHNPGAFGSYLVEGPTGRFLGFWAATVQACFAYTGTEVVGVAFGEAPNPRRTIRKAVRQTLWRIVFFYVLGALVLGMSVPYTNGMLIGGTKKSTGAAASPFVVAVQIANIPVFPHVVNGCLLIFVITPGMFMRTSGKGVPLYGVAATSVFAALAYMNAAKSSSQVYGYLVSLVTVFGTLNWVSVLTSYICFTRGMRAQGTPRSLMPYRGPLQPYGSYFALFVTILVVTFNGYNAFIPKFTVSTFMTSYIGVAIYLVNIFSYKAYAKTRRVELHSMDLVTNRLEDDGSKYLSTLEKAASWAAERFRR